MMLTVHARSRSWATYRPPDVAAATLTVILTKEEEIETWMTATPAEALALQRPLPDRMLQVVARGAKKDGEVAPL